VLRDPLGDLRGAVRVAVEQAFDEAALGLPELPDRHRQHAYKPARCGPRRRPPAARGGRLDGRV
jgi:hypothetical protein